MQDPDAMPAKTLKSHAIFVWDIYLRLFHWLLVIAVATSLISVQLDEMQIHVTSGIVIAALLIFRLAWGVIGSSTAQFHRFVRGPRVVAATLFKNRLEVAKNASDPTQGAQHPGHSPLGALSVIAMLAALVAQVSTGLFSDDEVFSSGPLARFVSSDFSTNATSLHGVNAKIIFALICIHIGAIVFYHFVKKDNLTLPMLSGKKFPSIDQANSFEPVQLQGFLRAAVAIALALCMGLFLYYV